MRGWTHCLRVDRLCCVSRPCSRRKRNATALGMRVPRCGCVWPRVRIRSAIVGERGYPSSIDVFVGTSAERTFAFADARAPEDPLVRYNVVVFDPPSADLNVISRRSV